MKGVKPSCEAKFANTPTPGATQHERSPTFMRILQPNPEATQHERDQTFMRSQLCQHPPTPGATQHERGQTFMRSQLRQHHPTPQPQEQRSTKGVKPSCGAKFASTPTPGATQQEKGQTFMQSQLRQHPNPWSNAAGKGSKLQLCFMHSQGMEVLGSMFSKNP